MPTLQMRLTSEDDRETVVHIFREAGLETDAALAEGTTYWVMEQDGQAIAAIGLEHGDGVSLLRGAAVLPSARGAGLGHRLVMSAVDFARAKGDRAIYMFSRGNDWSTFGFTQIPLAVVMADIPDAPQIRAFRERGERPGGTTWVRDLNG